MRSVAGRPLGSIRLSDGFAPEVFHPAYANIEVHLGAASGGEQEQIHVALRLALADYASRADRQLMVLDDSLLDSDARRLQRILAEPLT